ncbi:hypothetical protein [Microbacterium sp.]|uniref:hypothetical protein n=1 Tax=Microbacterium sp. TaxID=51671 RepID=UPI002632D677|nr:hypothetical protein [Microbacterium sp.]
MSHANADRSYVDKFVNSILIRGAELRSADIFYTSAADTGVGSGKNLMETVRNEAGSSQLVIAMVTPVYQTRPVCVAELGAAWARGVLFPVMAPGMKRSELEGVLPGLLIKAVDDDDVLDEISDRLSGLGYGFSASSFGVGKADWKSAMRGDPGVAKLAPSPSLDQLKRVEAELDSTRLALDQTRQELEEQRLRNDKLSRAKSAAEVLDADLPSDERERFAALRSQAVKALDNVSNPVMECIWHEISGVEMYLPNRMDDERLHDEILREVKDGRLNLDEETNEVSADPEFEEVGIALAATAALNEYLDEQDRSEPFVDWFKKEFKTPMNLSKKGCWNAII